MSGRARCIAAAAGLPLVLGCASVRTGPAARAAEPAGALSGTLGATREVGLTALRVEAGRIEGGPGGLRLRSPEIRAVVGKGGRRQGALLAFTYLGPTPYEVPLASGEVRRQIGLKLRAADTCNVVYVMWREAPVAGLEVLVKSNPGLHRHDECGDSGYLRLAPSVCAEVPRLKPGGRHALAARLDGARLRVYADGRPVWDGVLPPEALAINGPVGLRSDNGAFDARLAVIDEDEDD